MYQQTSFLDRFKSFFGSKSALPKLILINVIIWVLIRFLGVFAFLFSSPGTDSSASLFSFMTQWLAVPADLGILLLKPWTPFTYMFLHIDFWHLLFNMLWLFWFGQIFLQYLNNRQLVFTYISGGVAGAFLFIIFYNVFPAFESALPAALALGASASVLAIVVAIAFYVPNYSIYLLLIGPVKIKYVALFTIVIDFFMIRSGNAGGHIAHLGGAALGFIYISLLSKGMDFSTPFSFKRIGGIFGSFQTRKHKPFRNVYTSDKPLTDEEYNYQKAMNQKKIDSILEKIKRSGYDSLSKEEKELLFSSSRK
jgi:membrane associated rhomboid family serine protease